VCWVRAQACDVATTCYAQAPEKSGNIEPATRKRHAARVETILLRYTRKHRSRADSGALDYFRECSPFNSTSPYSN